VPQSSINKAPSAEAISILNTLCNDPKNNVFIVSGRGRDSLDEWFSPCEKLGIAAEHGYFVRYTTESYNHRLMLGFCTSYFTFHFPGYMTNYLCVFRWSKEAEWESSYPSPQREWKHIAEPVMQVYTETTDGSSIEPKESALVWHYLDADHDFGSCQAKELQDHLELVLSNEPVVVKCGHYIVEVKPQVYSLRCPKHFVVALPCWLHCELTERLNSCTGSQQGACCR
jgi:trehalose 6-phosphate synthase/phosphatase